MKYLQAICLALIPLYMFSCDKQDSVNENEERSTFYINTQEDFDQWSNHSFPEGSKVLFAAGETFTGQFIIRGSGTAENPNMVTAYDKVSNEILTEWNDNKPVIHGEGKVISTVLLKNGSYWEINNLEVTNTDGSTNDQGELLGINVVARDIGDIEDITIKNCYVHHVNGEVGGKQTGGIHVNVLGDVKKTRFINLLIENNRIAHVGGVGISNQSTWKTINSDKYYPWTNFAIRNNRVEYTGRNGIILRNAVDPVVEYNIAAYNSRFDTGHSIFNFNTIGCIVQYNEAYGNTSSNPDDIDHGGFDADYNSEGTIIQYNYSHDNNWFCGIMRKPYNKDITIRYNVSQNEQLGALLYGFPTHTGVEDVKIYNNTFYFGKGKGTKVFVAAGKTRIPTETSFYNNIFYFEDKADWGFEPDESCILQHNIYYNLQEKGDHAISADPLFQNPGAGGKDIDMTDPNRLSGYCLKTGSSAIDAGKEIEKNGNLDFSGSLLGEKPDIGAFEIM